MSREAKSFDTALAELRACIRTNTITGQHLAERVDEVARAHAHAIGASSLATTVARLDAAVAWDALRPYQPTDARGHVVVPGDFVDVGGDVRHVSGVDTEGGVFFQDEDGWDYTLACLHRRVSVDLDPQDDDAPYDLWDLACEIRRAWEDPDSDGNGEGMDGLIGRLLEMAGAAREAALDSWPAGAES